MHAREVGAPLGVPDERGCGRSWARASAHATGAEPDGGGSALVGLSAQEALDLGGELVSGGEFLLGALFQPLQDLLHVLVGRDRGIETQTLRLCSCSSSSIGSSTPR